MKSINWTYLLTAFLAMVSFSQASNAIIITDYTAFYEDGSKLVIDLKGYDYGEGSYYASSTTWNESPHPPVEGFDAFFYPSWQLQHFLGFGGSAKLEETFFLDDGLYFEVDKYYGVSMTSFMYLFFWEDWGISNNSIFFFYDNYHTKFSGGFFRTSTSPYPVDGPGSLALMIIGIASMGWVRQHRKA